MGNATRRIAGRRLVAAVLLVCMLAAVLVAVGLGSADAQTVSDDADAASSVRIAARKLANGSVEFGLQPRGGDIWLPQARFFAYATVEVGRWLRASPYGMSDGNDVRIRARRLADGKVEFALQVGADRQWLPTARNFPYRTAAVGRWLYSSWYTIGDPTTPLGVAPPAQSAPRDSSSCTFESAMSQVLPSVFQAVVTTSSGTGVGTAFYVGNNEFVTAAHVVVGATEVRLQNHAHTLTAVRVVGADVPSDVAVLRADGAGVEAMRFGEESEHGMGARVAAVGYPGAVYGVETGAGASIVSGLISSKWYHGEHDYVFYIQTDAAANPGNSGGPLINQCGEVIGLVVEKVVDEAVEGVIYAVTEQTIRAAIPRARQQGPQQTPTVPQARYVEFHLVQNVIGDGRDRSARYSLSTSCGFMSDNSRLFVALIEGRFTITPVLGIDHGARLLAVNTSGDACIATASVWGLPAHCVSARDVQSLNLATAGERAIIEFTIYCG